MLLTIKKYWEDKPLQSIIFLGVVVRLIAVVCSKGFGMHDDHFLVIEAAQSWVDGTDYNNWLPGSGTATPTGHSLFYVGVHFLIFKFFKLIGFDDIQLKMMVIRLLHAAFSLIIIWMGYRIAEKLYNRKAAINVGLLLALFWFMPFLSVRNLVEFVCIPFLMLGMWQLIKDDNPKLKNVLLAGILLGVGFSIRFQTLFFVGGVLLALLILKKWRQFFFVSLGVALGFILLQGSIDLYIWGAPFAEIKEYIIYNFHNPYSYLTNPWFTYILLLLGVLVPPVSIFLFFGFLRTWKKYLLFFLPVLIFLLAHSYFPNKQERFILPILPFFIILGVIGWQQFIESSIFWMKRKKIVKGSTIFFWIINILLLPFITTMYSKKARVEAMTYLSKYKNIKYILVEDATHGNAKMPPLYYLGQWVGVYELSESEPLDTLRMKLKTFGAEDYPRFALFYENVDLNKRVDSLKTVMPNLTFETEIAPSFIDEVLHRMNPRNANQTIYIYRNTDFNK